MELAMDVSGGTAVVTVAGDIDFDTAPLLQDRLRDAVASGAPSVVLDLAGTDFLDSSALGVLVGADKAARDAGSTLTITNASRHVRRVFELSRLDEVLDLVPRTGRPTEPTG